MMDQEDRKIICDGLSMIALVAAFTLKHEDTIMNLKPIDIIDYLDRLKIWSEKE